MKKLLKLLASPLLLGTLGLLLLCALVWWVGPLLGIGDTRPLQSPAVRVAVLLLMVFAWLGHLAWRAWRRRRSNAALLAGLGAGASGPSASDKEAQVLAQRFDGAVQRLKASQHGGLLASLGGGERLLYELPWYVFVGAPGSGKTTALLNAGLQFLLGDAGAAGKAAVQGVGGTRNCDWWFTKDAVLIDTAGRYATQESNREVDASAWDNFLALLKKTRPRQPINGVLLTVNVQDLLQQAAPERAEHAAQLRQRLQELQAKLGVRAPVYVLVTKADLIGGFNESFEALGQDERAQVWGFTFPVDTPADEPLGDYGRLYGQLQQRLVGQLMQRMDAERDVQRRSAMFAFPQEFAALQAPLQDFLRQVFSGGGAVEAAPAVRGVYFTSGTQEGSPIDRVMGALSRSFGIDARAAALPGGRGKSFFLQRLLKEVVFAERGLGVVDARAERRRRTLRAATAAALSLAGVAVLAGWAVSRSRNLDHAAQVAQRLPALQQAVAGLPPPAGADVAPLPAVLSAVRDAAQADGFAIDAPPLLNGLGLYQGDKLDAAAQQAHARLLQKTLMPRVARRLEERLRAAGRDNLENAYEALKAYVMLHDPAQFDAAPLRAWIAVDWDAQYPRMAPEQRAQLDAQLDTLLAQGAPRASLPRDDALVASVREMLSAFPLEVRIWSRIQRQYRAGEVPDFTVASAVGPAGQQVFERISGEPMTRGISGLYTKAGYERLVKPAVQKAALQLAREESWVLGLKADPAQLKDVALGHALSNKVKRLYLEAYVKAWDALLADVRLVRLSGMERSLAASRVLAAPDSPLAAWLRAVTEQTRLVPPAAAPGALDKLAASAKAEAASLAGGPAADAGGTGGPIERIVDDHFASLHRQVTGQPAPIDETLKLFGEIYNQLAAVDSAQKTGAPPPGGGGAARIKAAAGTLPAPMNQMLGALADAAANQGRDAERSALSTDLKPISDFCSRAITGRYPFASGSKADVLPEDFGQLFGAGGMMDDFFQRRLAPLVDIGKEPWVYRAVEGGKPVGVAALAEFQRAARIRDVFFRSGGKSPAMRFELRLSELEPTLKELVLDIDGQPHKLTTSGPGITLSWPSARVGSVVKLTTGLGDRGPQVMFEGPWALFRLFERFEVQPGSVPEKFGVVMNLDGKRARIDVIAASVFNPFQMREIKQFRCPSAL